MGGRREQKRTAEQSLHDIRRRCPLYARGMGVCATSASSLAMNCDRSGTRDLLHRGQVYR